MSETWRFQTRPIGGENCIRRERQVDEAFGRQRLSNSEAEGDVSEIDVTVVATPIQGLHALYHLPQWS